MWPFRKVRRPETSEEVTNVFLELFRGHGLPCDLRDGWIVSTSGTLGAQARVFTKTLRPGFYSTQLDLDTRSTLLDGRFILESCVGVGDTAAAAVAEAIRDMCDGSFHVIFSALTGEACSHNEVEEWTVGGVNRKAFIGPAMCRGMGPPEGDWFMSIQAIIQGTPMPKGIHWLRLYHAEIPGGENVDEALFDNEIHPYLQARLGSFPWPDRGGFYSVRLFFIFVDA